MKSKAYVLMQIKELLDTNRGLCEEEIEQWMEENKEKSVCELLVIKKELAEKKIFQDISCMNWFRENDQ
jgi:hypothetical protein